MGLSLVSWQVTFLKSAKKGASPQAISVRKIGTKLDPGLREF